MDTSKQNAYRGLLIIAALVFGKGLHLLITPEFWGPEPLLVRIDCVLRLLVGAAIYWFARRLKPSP